MRWNHQLDIKALQMGTPPKISIEPENNGLEDFFPSWSVFSSSMLIFWGVTGVE